jgi:integrase
MDQAMKLTRTNAAKLSCEPGRAETFHWDSELPGFGLRVLANGRRRWVVQYRTGGGQRRLTIGDPAIVPADKARDHAVGVLAKVKLGQDPQGDRQAERRAIRVDTLIEQYLAEAVRRMKPRSLIETTRHLNTHAKPLHARPAAAVERQEIATLLNSIRTSSGGVAANRVRSSLSALWHWAIMSGLQELNPVTNTAKVAKEVSRERVLSEAELTAIWRETGSGSDYDRIVRLLMLTGARRDEVGRMSWPEIDRDLWTLPSARSKNGLPHEVLLPALALAQLPALKRDRDTLFGKTNSGFSGWSRCKARLDARLNAAGGADIAAWTLHDLRRTVSTGLSEMGVQPHIVEAVLNHVPVSKRKVAGTYNKATYREPKRQALNDWAVHVARLAGTDAGNVIALGKRGA